MALSDYELERLLDRLILEPRVYRGRIVDDGEVNQDDVLS